MSVLGRILGRSAGFQIRCFWSLTPARLPADVGAATSQECQYSMAGQVQRSAGGARQADVTTAAAPVHQAGRQSKRAPRRRVVIVGRTIGILVGLLVPLLVLEMALR